MTDAGKGIDSAVTKIFKNGVENRECMRQLQTSRSAFEVRSFKSTYGQHVELIKVKDLKSTTI